MLVDRFLLPEPKAELVAELTQLAISIEDALNRRCDASLSLARYQQLCGRQVQPVEFVAYYGSMTTEQFVRGTLVPEPVPDPSISDDDLQELIRRIVSVECPDDNHYGYWLRVLEVNIPHPSVASVFASHQGASPSELLRKAREYKPTCL